MKIFSTIKDLRSELNLVKSQGKSLGLVPTMGALHGGHLTLIDNSKHKCDLTIVSLFVNPAQFNKPEDLEKYPRDFKGDISVLEKAQCDYVFAPSVQEMYPTTPELKVDFGNIETRLEGEHRPGHFRGVGLVVSKLLNIVQPTHAFFGQKDVQQFFIIKKLVEELSFQVKLTRVPTIREKNGLAMSSRNERLSPQQRSDASLISKCLQLAKDKLMAGIDVKTVEKDVISKFNSAPGMELEYFEIVETKNFNSISSLDHAEIAICIAVNVGEVRLIDNMLLFS